MKHIVSEGWVNVHVALNTENNTHKTEYKATEGYNSLFDDLLEITYENGSKERVIITGFSVDMMVDKFELKGKRFRPFTNIEGEEDWDEMLTPFSSIASKNEFRNMSNGSHVTYEESHDNEGNILSGYCTSPQFYISSMKDQFKPIFLNIVKRRENIE